jgi:antitoxin component of RelBE/YafQ-DinJ toxin-antitoxin module
MKDVYLQVRIEPEVKAEWFAMAQARGLTLSEFVRRCVEESSKV